MEDTIISFKTAILARNRGFKSYNCLLDKWIKIDSFGVTQSMLQRWLRKKHNIHIAIRPIINPNNSTSYYIYKSKKQLVSFEERYDTYELALEAALIEALKLIK